MILRVLREHRDRAISTFTITQGITHHGGLELDRQTFIRFTKSVLKQLNELKNNGHILHEGESARGVTEDAYGHLLPCDGEP